MERYEDTGGILSPIYNYLRNNKFSSKAFEIWIESFVTINDITYWFLV